MLVFTHWRLVQMYIYIEEFTLYVLIISYPLQHMGAQLS